MEIITYICDCEKQFALPVDAPLPQGWGWRQIPKENGGCVEMPVCGDCIISLRNQETHDNTSAVNDTPPPIVRTGERKWQITVTFLTDKGCVEAVCIIHAANIMAALDEMQVVWSRLPEMVTLTVVLAPLDFN